MNRILACLASVFVAVLLVVGGCSSEGGFASDAVCVGVESNVGVSGVSGVGERSAGVKGVVHVFVGRMFFPLTAGVVPLGVSVRVYAEPSSVDPSSYEGEGDFMEGDFVLELRNGGVGVFEQRFRVDRPVLGLNVLPMTIRDGDSLSVVDAVVFTVRVAEFPVYDSFAVLWAGRELFTAEKSSSEPSAEVLGVSEGQVFGSGDVIDLCLRGIDDDGDELTYRIFSSTDEGVTYRLYTGSSLYPYDDWQDVDSPRAVIRPGSTPGRGLVDRIGVAVSDGASSVFEESPSFRVVSGSYGVRITSPEKDAVLSAGASVFLDARSEIASGNVEFRWRSNLDGDLGAGGTVELPVGELAVGEHTITVTAAEEGLGVSYADSVRFFVVPPDVPFKAFDDNVHVAAGELVQLDVRRNDTQVSQPGRTRRLEVTVPAELGKAAASKYGGSDTPFPVISYISRVSGRDSFEYEVCDRDSFCDTATVHVSVGLDDCTISGTNEDDTLVGTPADDIICALDGNDTIEGLGGDDIIRGGAGDDTIFGGAGDDYIQGETGGDTIHGNSGEDLILGGDGSDTLYGGAGYDTLGGGNTITEQNPGDKLYYTSTAAPAAYPELTAEETELLDTAINTCEAGPVIRLASEVSENNECAQTTNQLCQTANNSQQTNHQKQRTAITRFVCEAAGLGQTIATAYQNRPYDPYPDSQTIELRDTLKRETQTLFTPLVEDNHQITETTTAKLRQLAEAIHDFAVPIYRDDPHPIG